MAHMRCNFSRFILLSVSFVCLTASGAFGADAGWSCKVDGKEWKDPKGGASLNAGLMTLYSSDDRIEGVYIQTNKDGAVGEFTLNDGAVGSFTDPAGAQSKSKSGSGKLVISKFTATVGDTKGKVEGTFSGNFESATAKVTAITECTFILPLKNL